MPSQEHFNGGQKKIYKELLARDMKTEDGGPKHVQFCSNCFILLLSVHQNYKRTCPVHSLPFSYKSLEVTLFPEASTGNEGTQAAFSSYPTYFTLQGPL